ncbi:Cation/H+ exchanger [Cynara cardunculus var. scolymus]|uniref:Cation/H+ exchanger n=1 Tax=Cynara cardunculus var. scolymus TaxID=59895 RepID=A0A118K1K5_CYNCS|nr:Cation/H+ exchanger [Cynara cardunculus var. scolymus]
MDEVFCRDNVNPALSLTTQVSSILILSHVFQIFLKPLGQHAPVAQILAGFILGPSVLSRSPQIYSFFFENFVVDFYESLALFSRIIIMFLIGLETDVSYILRHWGPTSIVACCGCLICSVLATAIAFFVYEETGSRGSRVMLALVLTVILANAASPIVFRLVADLKFATTDFGRLAICSSLIVDMYAMFILIIITGAKYKETFLTWVLKGFCSVLLLAGVVVFTTYLANWLNHRNRNQKNLKAVEVMLICAVIIFAAMTLETMGFSSIIACFIMGSMFPRGGKSGRTLLTVLTYMVHNFIFPIYFGYTGFRADITYLNKLKNVGIVLMVILSSIGGKIIGTLVACHYLKTPLKEGILLAFLLNMKGHVDLLTLTSAMLNNELTSLVFYNLMLIAIVISSLVSSMLVSFLVKRESETIGVKHIPLEYLSPMKELIVLACVHSPHPVPTMVQLVVSLRGSQDVPITPYLMHLVELPEKPEDGSPYHKHQEDEFSDDEDHGADDAVEINEAVDVFTADTKTVFHQVKNVSPYLSMFQDVCELANDICASIIILPFHKHQRIDGKLEKDKEAIRITNQKVLRHAQCSVAVLIDRGHNAIASQVAGSEPLQRVATLFFGGPDDREALGLSKRLSTHDHMILTIIRFLPTSTKEVNKGLTVSHKGDDVLVAAVNNGTEIEGADRTALNNFYHR